MRERQQAPLDKVALDAEIDSLALSIAKGRGWSPELEERANGVVLSLLQAGLSEKAIRKKLIELGLSRAGARSLVKKAATDIEALTDVRVTSRERGKNVGAREPPRGAKRDRPKDALWQWSPHWLWYVPLAGSFFVLVRDGGIASAVPAIVILYFVALTVDCIMRWAHIMRRTR